MFSDLVRHTQIDTKITQVELAEKLGIAQGHLSRDLKKDDFKESRMREIAEALGCELVIELRPKSTES
ncbi:helix-turn-helix domain-containing protein [Eubacterium limosum]|uniref:helix-turn-helix domain-containing protein n=1 Tax=Eubacterium limosum TaxID=1736 RepID=UPI001D090F08|nr:helix-turn-helix domain-containing protein [Eubacterium limosum]MCB6569485.1 helix-turn-helix domain-containing protein [Eubacterium limosum]